MPQSRIHDFVQPIDQDQLRRTFQAAKPFPFVLIDGFLEPEFALDVERALPSLEEAESKGRRFRAVNERGKTQVTDLEHFPGPVRQLNEVLAHPDWLRTLSSITGIADLRADERLLGGGIHMMAPSAHLDVHVDFNLIEDRLLHRRLNLLLFFNSVWRPEWAGGLELWDRDVRRRHHHLLPLLNRCVVFETSEHSFHGVEKVLCPPGFARKSFAVYYYTDAAPLQWAGRRHSTIFRARPDERLKRFLLMPASTALGQALRPFRKVRRTIARYRSSGRRPQG